VTVLTEVKPKRPPRRSSPARRQRRPSRLLLWGSLLVLVAAAGAVGAAVLLWPAPRIELDQRALGRIALAPFGERVVAAEAVTGGHRAPLRLQDGRLWPGRPLAPGARVVVELTVERAPGLRWLVGKRTRARLVVRTPLPRLAERWPLVKPGAVVSVRFARPVSRVRVAGAVTRTISLRRPARVVPTGIRASGELRSGTIAVSAAARPWESLSPPARVTWFPSDRPSPVLVRPAPGSDLQPRTTLTLTFGRPVAAVLGDAAPRLEPAIAGTWSRPDAHTLVFRPAAHGYPLETRVRLTLPRPVSVARGAAPAAVRTLSWQMPTGSPLRLHQLLAVLGYLPLRWTATRGDVFPRTYATEAAAALEPPPGRFDWRWPDVPPQLRALWAPDRVTVLTQGAVMRFEEAHGLRTDGIAGRRVWDALLRDAIVGRPADGPYSYVLVHRSVPQTLSLWEDGRTIMQTRVNTGVPAAPTELGTFPVFLRLRSQTMRGVNPDGSHYADPGIRWISYFHGGEGIHGFDRSSYGFPQSVGCVELPVAAAAQVWPHTPIGTLVTIAP